MTELPILPSDSEAPITAIALGLNIRFITPRISSFEYTGGGVSSWSKSTMKGASAGGARVPLVEVDDEAGVDGGRAALGGEDRVEVDLGDLREVGDELGDRLDDVGQPLDVDAGPAAHAVQDLRRLDAVDHLEGGLARHRREAERHVAQDLDQDAAE